MINRKNLSGETEFFAITAIAICAVLVAAAAGLLAPAAATSNELAHSTATYASPTGYFPDQFVNQAKEVEPMPEMYY